MKLVWTTSQKPLSVVIRKLLREPVSHFAIVFKESSGGGIAFHSNLLGCHIQWLGTFTKQNQVIYEIDISLPLHEEEEIYQNIVGSLDGKQYDIPALLFFGFRLVLNRLFGWRMPSKNAWQSDDRYLCLALVKSIPTRILPRMARLAGIQDIEIVSPYQLYLKLTEEKK